MIRNKTLLMGFGCMMYFMSTVVGQTIKQPTPLSIGDELPNIEIQKIVNEQSPKMWTADIHQKLLILSFFDTYCVNCIEAMPKLHDIQNTFPNDVKVMMVTYQKEDLIQDFYAKNKFIAENDLKKMPTVVEDSVLRKYFPHQVISHMVMIYEGEVVAITHSPYITIENVQRVLDNKVLDVPLKMDVANFDRETTFKNKELNHPFQRGLLSQSILTGYRPGIENEARGIQVTYDSIHNETRGVFYNMSVFDACRVLLFGLKKQDFLLIPARIAIDVAHQNEYRYDPALKNYDKWAREHAICHERIVPGKMDNHAMFQLMLSDLEAYFKINASWQEKTIPCLVMKKAENYDDIRAQTEEGIGLKSESSSVLAFMIDFSTHESGNKDMPPVIDEMRIADSFYMQGYGSIEELKSQLSKQGVNLELEERQVDVLVFRSVNP